jgi:hypothetical protein
MGTESVIELINFRRCLPSCFCISFPSNFGERYPTIENRLQFHRSEPLSKPSLELSEVDELPRALMTRSDNLLCRESGPSSKVVVSNMISVIILERDVKKMVRI